MVSAFIRLLLLAAVAAAASSASSLAPPALPLFVRNPYLSTWLSHAREAPWDHWPIFYTGRDVGFSVMAYVPSSGTVYPLLGRPQDSLPSREGRNWKSSAPIYQGSSFDGSTTNLTYLLSSEKEGDDDDGGPVRLTLSFLSPITPTSTARQAIPAAYLSIHAQGQRDLSVYVDANGDWVTGNRDNPIRWDLLDPDPTEDSGPRVKSWRVSRVTEQLFTEQDDRAEWGTFYLSAPSHVQHACGESALLRREFAETGRLSGSVDPQFRPVFYREPVFAFAHEFKLGPGNETSSAASIVLSVALVQDPVVQFAAERGLTMMRPLWASYFESPEELVRYHLGDFSTAAALAANYSAQLAEDALASGAEGYRDITALSARQVLGATQFSGTVDNPLIFLKEISSNGNMQTVDVIFPSFPFFLYTNPRWLAYLLEPLLEHQRSGNYPNPYSMHDLGSHFPNATGHADGNDEYMPVEECGNMVIMALGLANALRHDSEPRFSRGPAAGARPMPALPSSSSSSAPGGPQRAVLAMEADEFGIDKRHGAHGAHGTVARDWLTRNYRVLDQWTGFLVQESLTPHNQLCTDDFAGWLANQTNLALKGIIAIRAMSEIADLTGDRAAADAYGSTATDYIAKWQELAISRDGTHAKLAYTWYGSWTTLYNLFADSLLCFHIRDQPQQSPREKSKRGVISSGQTVIGPGPEPLIPDRVYMMQSQWYKNVVQRYGLPLDSRHLYAKSDWEFFAAAVASTETRETILQSIALWVDETSTDRPLTDLYLTEGDGGYPGIWFFARPVVGGHFALLALDRACQGRARAGLAFLDRGQLRAGREEESNGEELLLAR